MAEIVHLPRPKNMRPQRDSLGLYLRPSYGQHKEMLDALAGGRTGFTGIVVDATNADRHKELMAHANQAGLDIVLDPKTAAMATPGGFSKSMAKLPWGSDRVQNADDYSGLKGRDAAARIAEFSVAHGYTQVLGPTHWVSGANDRWLRRDIENVNHLKATLRKSSSDTQVIYPLVVSMQVLRDPLQRAALVAAVADAQVDAVWFKVDNFGSDASGEKTVAYIQAIRDFHALGLPVVADHVGGLSAAALLSFGAVGGIAQGVTMLEGFKANRWLHAPKGKQSGGQATRVYLPQIDMFLKPDEAEAFVGSSTRTRTRFGCRDTHCCPGGMKDTLANPTSHFIHQRVAEIEAIAQRPQSIRAREYVDKTVRPVSDHVSSAVGLGAISDDLRKKLAKKQKLLGSFREAIAHFSEVDSLPSAAAVPLSRAERAARG